MQGTGQISHLQYSHVNTYVNQWECKKTFLLFTSMPVYPPTPCSGEKTGQPNLVSRSRSGGAEVSLNKGDVSDGRKASADLNFK